VDDPLLRLHMAVDLSTRTIPYWPEPKLQCDISTDNRVFLVYVRATRTLSCLRKGRHAMSSVRLCSQRSNWCSAMRVIPTPTITC